MQESSSNLPPSVLNFSPFAHEISSVEAPKEGKFENHSVQMEYLGDPRKYLGGQKYFP